MKDPYKSITINGKHKLEHRYIMEQFIGRKLTRFEFVHHINGNKKDNRIENLKIMSPQEHNKLHKEKLPKTKICKVCGKEFEPPVNHRGRNTICSPECWKVYRKQLAKKYSLKIDQFDIEGHFIKTWDSIHEIGRFYKKDPSNICACCKGKLKTSWHYIWKYHL